MMDAMLPEPVDTPNVKAVGPYSPAVRAGDWLVLSGQVGIDPESGELAPGGAEAQARQALANITRAMADCGATWEHVAKVTLFIATDTPEPMKAINALYQEVVGDSRPARSTVGVTWLPMGAAFEVEAWVYQPENWHDAS